MDAPGFLVVQKGAPYGEGHVLHLKSGRMLIGRRWEDHVPDIWFDDPRISRSHAEITYKDGQFVLCDLPTSKHGTEINGRPLSKGMPYVLSHNDKISLARGIIRLLFCCQDEPGGTLDHTELNGEPSSGQRCEDRLEQVAVDPDRREVLIGDREMRPRITGREFELLLLLYQNRGKAVSHEDIISWVWRDIPHRETITRTDVNTLAHRLRKSLGEHGDSIVSISSYGYRLD